MELSKLKPNPDNPRLIKDDKFQKLVKSIQDFPEMMEKRPMVCVTDTDGKLYPLGGNMRLRAIQEIGMEKIPDEWIVLADNWTQEQRREFVIKDNVGFGEWDWEQLANEWDADDLSEWGLDIPDFGEAEQLEAVEDDFDGEVPAEPVTALGDLYEIGEHRLLCGDSTDSDAVAKLMNGEKCHLITDPPYGINANKQTLGTGKKEFYRGGDWDGRIPEFYFVIEMCDKSIIWGGNYFADKLPVNNDWLCWHKKNDGLSFSEFELAWTNIGKNCRLFSHHWGGEQKLHPTMKPVKLIEWCINLFEDAQVILDVFLGSGTTMVASHQLKRKCYGMELDCRYCDVIVNRMLKLDPNLTVKRNGQDVTSEWLKNIE